MHVVIQNINQINIKNYPLYFKYTCSPTSCCIQNIFNIDLVRRISAVPLWNKLDTLKSKITARAKKFTIQNVADLAVREQVMRETYGLEIYEVTSE